MTLNYRIVVPSRGRPQNMAKICAMLPSATILVAEDEAPVYKLAIGPDNKLVTHPGSREGITGLPKVFNWILDNFDEETIVEVDDDLQMVFGYAGEGARRQWNRIRNPDDILDIIENSARISEDLDISTFCWAKSGNSAFLKLDQKPIQANGLVANAFGVRGSARNRHYDPEMIGRASVDWTLRTLLEDRFIYMDKRFFWDCGKIFSGTGGNSGFVDGEKFRKSTDLLRERWGAHVRFGGNTSGMHKNKQTDGDGKVIKRHQGDRQVAIMVSRHNHSATR